MTLQQQLDVAVAHHRAGRMAEAEAAYQQILQEQPDHADALYLLGTLAAQGGKFDEAVSLIERAIRASPSIAEYYGNLAVVFQRMKRWDDSIAASNRAIQLKPQLAHSHYTLGCTYNETDQHDLAVISLRNAIAIDPRWPDPYSNLGLSLLHKRQFDEAVEALRKSIAVRPDYVDGHWNLGLIQLLLGDFAAGWVGHEWRYKVPAVTMRRDLPQPRWGGEDLLGKTILLHTEQGSGDSIQFIRYAPMVAQCGGKVILDCSLPLLQLFEGFAGIDQIVPSGKALPQFDVQCPLMSLPLIFGTTVQTIPAKVPYLNPSPQRIAEWGRRFDPADRRKRIGLVWSGRVEQNNNRRRSMRLDHFAPLAAVKSARFISLQKGDPAEQAANPPPGLDFVDWSADLHDFVDTAALIANLDLVISVDTAPAHLAGAMGKPVWLLLPYSSDWRWMLDRDDSPWYPTMRLFRQKTRGDWTGVVHDVARELTILEPSTG